MESLSVSQKKADFSQPSNFSLSLEDCKKSVSSVSLSNGATLLRKNQIHMGPTWDPHGILHPLNGKYCVFPEHLVCGYSTIPINMIIFPRGVNLNMFYMF